MDQKITVTMVAGMLGMVLGLVDRSHSIVIAGAVLFGSALIASRLKKPS